MSPLYIFAFIIHCVFSITPCKDGVEIVSTETKNPEDLLGTWTYAYQWVPKIEFIKESFYNANLQFECPLLHIEAITPELVKAKEAECAKYKIPFNWADAKLKVDAPALNTKLGVIIFGDKENWMAVDCITMVRVVIKKVSDDYIAMIITPHKNNAAMNSQTALIVREPPTLDELKCVANNIDVGKGMSGFGICS